MLAVSLWNKEANAGPLKFTIIYLMRIVLQAVRAHLAANAALFAALPGFERRRAVVHSLAASVPGQ